jgi:hypothetical protein
MLEIAYKWRLRALVGHLEEQQIRQLFDVAAIAHPVVAQDVAVVPELWDDLRGGRHSASSSCELVVENEAVARRELETLYR